MKQNETNKNEFEESVSPDPAPPKTEKQKKFYKNPPRRSKNTSNFYFTDDTHAAIVEYQIVEDQAKRNKLYISRIMPAFEKLVENLINIHKFSSVDDSFEEIKSDCMSFLFETIHKFDPNRGTKAFSYFNVCAKRWLIIRTKMRMQKVKKIISLDENHESSILEEKHVESSVSDCSQDSLLERRATAQSIIDMLYEVRLEVSNKNDVKCINAIITVFEKIDELDILNKRALVLYIREITGLSLKEINKSLATIIKLYVEVRDDLDFEISDSEFSLEDKEQPNIFDNIYFYEFSGYRTFV